MNVLRGPRVTLRHWRDDDLAAFAALNADPEVMRQFMAPLTRAESDALATRIRTNFETRGFAQWALDVPGIGFAGFVGLSRCSEAPMQLGSEGGSLAFTAQLSQVLRCGLSLAPFEPPLPGVEAPMHEIGWRLARAAWGQGYATEAARLALRHGFEALRLPQVVSFTALTNLASQAVMRRIGLSLRGEFDHPRMPEGHVLRRHVLYAVDAPLA